jgi:hypothetical protein
LTEKREREMKKNCWEFKKCGNGPGGAKGKNTQVCPVPEMGLYNGINGGTNAGRACWIVADSACDGDVQMTFRHKLKACVECDFYNAVSEEEGAELALPLKVLEDLLSGIK